MFGLLFVRTTTTLVVFGVIIAALNFRNTDVFRRATGVSPWHIPPIYWALASVFVSVVITVLTLIAMRTTKVPGPGKAMTRTRYGFPGSMFGSVPRAPDQFESLPNPARLFAPGAIPRPGSPGLAPAGWHVDPSGRHHYRFWNGYQWTEHVATDGVSTTDVPS
ncbi:MAG TPA: DUF2510 domain-containing protein [Acidimicrobiales bacterium]|jgi:hypothetical protein